MSTLLPEAFEDIGKAFIGERFKEKAADIEKDMKDVGIPVNEMISDYKKTFSYLIELIKRNTQLNNKPVGVFRIQLDMYINSNQEIIYLFGDKKPPKEFEGNEIEKRNIIFDISFDDERHSSIEADIQAFDKRKKEKSRQGGFIHD